MIFLLDFLKHIFYSSSLEDLAHLRQRISKEIILIETETLKIAFLNMEKILQLIKETNSCHIKQL